MCVTAEEIINYESYQKHKNYSNPYQDSPFNIYRIMSSKRKGCAFEKIFEEFMNKNGHETVKNQNSDHDKSFLIDNEIVRYEVKGSLIWGESENGNFCWQQIRPDQDYDRIAFLAFYPDRLDIYVSDKNAVSKYVDFQDEKGNWKYNQHGGKNVRSGAFIIRGRPEDFDFMEKL